MVKKNRSKTPSPPPSISCLAFQPGKPGDWQCPNLSCRNHQTPGCFASAAACKQCGAPKPSAFALQDSSATKIPGESIPAVVAAGATVLYRRTARSRGLPFDIHASSGAMKHDTSGGVMCASFAAYGSLDKGSLRQAIEAATATGAPGLEDKLRVEGVCSPPPAQDAFVISLLHWPCRAFDTLLVVQLPPTYSLDSIALLYGALRARLIQACARPSFNGHIVLPLLGAHPGEPHGVRATDVFQELLSLLQWAATTPALKTRLQQVTIYAHPDTIHDLELRFGVAAGSESVDSLVGGQSAGGDGGGGGVELGSADLRRAIQECSTLLPPRVREEAEGVAILAELSITTSLAWPACAAARRVGELIIRQGAAEAAMQENLSRLAVTARPFLDKVREPMLALVRVGNKGAHTEACCQDVDTRYACAAVAATLRGLYR
jgi:hypothetical protein